MDSSSNETHKGLDKCWLIRTTQRQILGPVSKEKILSFLEKGALSPEDELACGNGYWFSIKEKDLIEKYLLGDIPQSFNPISEAPSVLTAPHDQSEGTASLHPNPLPHKDARKPVVSTISDEEGTQLPAQDDLEYPDMDSLLSSSPPAESLDFGEVGSSETEDITTVLKLEKSGGEEKRELTPQEENRSQLIAEVEEEVSLPDEEDLEYPDMGDMPPAMSEVDAQQENESELSHEGPVVEEISMDKADVLPPESSVKKKGQKRKKKSLETPQRNDRYLFYLIGLLIVLTMSVFYYYKKVLNKPFPIIGEALSLFIPEVQAQNLVQDPLGIKKKDFSN